MADDSTDLMAEITDLWSDEYCDFKIDFEPAPRNVEGVPQWAVSLVWTSEYGNLHAADWATYSWLFYGNTLAEALREACVWCRGLMPFKKCGACDGAGVYWSGANADRHTVTCDECVGTGLAHGGDDA